MTRLLLSLLALTLPASAQAGRRAQWLHERFSVELQLVGGWRAAAVTNSRGSGFEVLGGGGELVLGLDTPVPWLGLFVSGRFVGYGIKQYQGDAGLGLLFHPRDRIHVHVGASCGVLHLVDNKAVPAINENAIPIGGFLGTTVELFRLGNRLSTAVSARFDVVDLLGAGAHLPDTSITLSVGAGIHY